MSKIIEQALELPHDEKVRLFYALKEDLRFEDDKLIEDELTTDQWKALNQRIADIKTGKSTLLSLEEFKQKMEKKTNEIRNSN
ncbi:MAG: addiction module protein [Chitinophagaceae bacterium]|nr:addiction module protein [Chitinophagaceae bacterium]